MIASQWGLEACVRVVMGSAKTTSLVLSIELFFNSSWFLIESWYFCFQNLPCLVGVLCMFGGHVEVWTKSILYWFIEGQTHFSTFAFHAYLLLSFIHAGMAHKSQTMKLMKYRHTKIKYPFRRMSSLKFDASLRCIILATSHGSLALVFSPLKLVLPHDPWIWLVH